MTKILSPRETEILALASQGKTDKGIANDLGISTTTVVTYWVRIRAKLGQLARSELVAEYVRAEAEGAVEALRQTLEAQIRRGTELDRQQQTLADFIDQAPEAMLFFDLSGYVTRANKMAEELLDASEGALIGLKVDHFLPEHVRAVHDSYRERYLSDPLRLEIGHQTGIEIVTLGGRTFTGIVTLSLAHSPSGDAVVAIMRALDIDARQTDSRAQRLRDMA